MMTGIDNELFIDTDGVCMTRLFKHGVLYDTIVTDSATAAHFKGHLSKTPCLWNVNDEPPKAPHGSTGGGDNLSQDPKAIWAREYRKKKRGW